LVEKESCTDLQALVERAGRCYAAAVGEEYVEERRCPTKGATNTSASPQLSRRRTSLNIGEAEIKFLRCALWARFLSGNN
jgi:hypothetical protein